MICKRCKENCFVVYTSNNGHDLNAVSNCCGAGIDYVCNNENKIKDGGPAFPCDEITTYKGMTLRDYFAAKAMQGLIHSFVVSSTDSFLVAKAYSIADTMLEAREK